MIAYPFDTKYQNSNQWVLEVLTAALSPNVSNRKKAQTYLESTDYQPFKIPLKTHEKLGTKLFKANVSFDDHPRIEMREHLYSVVAVSSLLDYMKQRKIVNTSTEF